MRRLVALLALSICLAGCASGGGGGSSAGPKGPPPSSTLPTSGTVKYTDGRVYTVAPQGRVLRLDDITVRVQSVAWRHSVKVGFTPPGTKVYGLVKLTVANLTKALSAGGAKLSDVTKITIYLCNPHDVPKARGILQTYFEGHPPGSTLCILRGLANPNFLLEIEAIAAV